MTLFSFKAGLEIILCMFGINFMVPQCLCQSLAMSLTLTDFHFRDRCCPITQLDWVVSVLHRVCTRGG